MSGKGRKQQLTWQDYLVVYNLIWTNDGQVIFNEEYYIKEELNPEEILIKKELFLSLSKDAREVIKIIMDAPTELFCNIYNKVSKMKIQKMLMQEKKWQRRKVNKAFKEIKLLVKKEEL